MFSRILYIFAHLKIYINRCGELNEDAKLLFFSSFLFDFLKKTNTKAK